jgi:flagellar hook-associated protein 1 FlgK
VSIYGIAVSALNVAQVGISTTEHNIANASTPGYSRQQMTLSANTPMFTGSGYIGTGVNVANVKRAYSDFMTNQVIQQQGASNQLNTWYTQIQQVDNMLSDSAASLSASIQNFFSGVNGVATSPQSQAASQTLMSGAQSLVSRFQALGQRLSELRSGLNGQISASVTSINSYATQIASLNQSITLATASGNGQIPNDLMDQRDQLINLLSQEVQASVTKQTDGSYNVFIGNGQPLVVGQQTFSLQAVTSLTDTSQLEVAYQTASGQTVRTSQSSFQGGNLGGLLNFRSQTLDVAQNSLGRIAIGLASSYNTQNNLGMDANGALGTDLFSVPAPTSPASSANTGTAAISTTVSSVSALTTSDYQLVSNGGTAYTLIRLSDNTTTALASLPQTVDGLTISLASGTANAGDSFMIRPTFAASTSISLLTSDPTKVAAASPVKLNAASANTGTATLSGILVNATPVVANPAHPATDLNLQQPVTITFNNPPTTFNVTGTGIPAGTVNVAYTAGSAISYNGWTFSMSGAPAAGDVFTVSSNVGATSDNTNALLLAKLQTATTLAGNTLSLEGAYAQLVGQTGSKTAELKVTSEAQTTLLSQTTQQQQSIAGVNLDEEAANLMQYQRAYQAAGKALQVANTIFDTLLSLK